MSCTCTPYRGLTCTVCYSTHYHRRVILDYARDYLHHKRKADHAFKSGDGAGSVTHAAEAHRALLAIVSLGRFQNTDQVVQFIRTEQSAGSIV